jgi:hypothetical protein
MPSFEAGEQMRVTKSVSIDTEVEVSITSEDIASSLMMELSEFERLEGVDKTFRRSLMLVNDCAKVLRAIPDEHIAEMSQMHCKCIADFLREQLDRYENVKIPKPVHN